ncbi:MAG: Rhomboid family protein [Pedosphaera sp.]|nr:Rhomboid family protein [Pedosphaera sp.]
MRMIGYVDGEANARKFSDYLAVQGIENQMEADKAGTWGVWIREEEALERAKAMLAAFQANPADPKFQDTGAAARKLREQKKQEQAAYEKRMKSRRHLFRTLSGYGVGPLTFVLIAASVVVFVLSKFGNNMQAVLPLFISEVDVRDGGILARFTEGLPEIKHGEVWRLFTPMFVHFTFLHIFFNMLWLRELGSMIEARQGSLYFLILVLVFSAVPNLAQNAVSGPVFGGMSGVVYGLVGYIWIRGKFDPGSGLFLHPSTVTMMVIWFCVGLTGVLGVANTAHGAGLALGMAWGYLSSLRRR